jgi:hypothetical protein
VVGVALTLVLARMRTSALAEQRRSGRRQDEAS